MGEQLAALGGTPVISPGMMKPWPPIDHGKADKTAAGFEPQGREPVAVALCVLKQIEQSPPQQAGIDVHSSSL